MDEGKGDISIWLAPRQLVVQLARQGERMTLGEDTGGSRGLRKRKGKPGKRTREQESKEEGKQMVGERKAAEELEVREYYDWMDCLWQRLAVRDAKRETL